MGFFDKLFGRNDLTLREPQFAGMLYPAGKAELRAAIERLLSGAEAGDEAPRALIVPHAEFDFAGEVMARAWARVAGAEGIERIVLLGSSRLVPFRGLAVTGYDGFDTPMGPVVSDREAVESIARLEQVRAIEPAFDPEESIEAQLPFVRQVLKKTMIVPVLVGDATDEEVAEVLSTFVDDPATLIVICANMSHDVEPEQAHTLDAQTQAAIETLVPESISREHSAGRVAIRGLLRVANEAGWKATTLARSTSADAAVTDAVTGPVTGYGAFAFYSPGG
ncbi:AmmeMemoRadiSam system protein B [Persicimonas caeni]|uniref:AmmeMemoRadiSam system protein B n=1 Tax=Persicimonas caeni TaxID=2292766 RepID=A0A4Y6PPZ1_PERCE|nr:AmmeMemoRadiSam system protein B [Persicimonas caeni]QDG50394.1 AmmeMemoRadiSam system protein B [Persicimonas caeni]QED31615.1 AmmeMemoRadiSam system protein B [Persicimonas caeni]